MVILNYNKLVKLKYADKLLDYNSSLSSTNVKIDY